MKRVLIITVSCVLAAAPFAAAQSTTTTPSERKLAEVAKDEEARRKSVRKPARVYTNSDLKPDTSRVPTASTPTVDAPSATPVSATPATTAAVAPTGADPSATKDQAYWAARISKARSELTRAQLFAESLQSRINALTTQYVNRDDRVQREQVFLERQTALSELERVKQEVANHTKAIATIEEEARRAGVPAGWLRN